MPYQQYVHLQKRKIAEADRALGIERSRILAKFFNIPEHPDSAKFLQLASAIERIPYSVPVCFETQEARVWMRCVQLYWNAKAIALAARLYLLPMPDPLTEGGFIQTHLLPLPAFHNFRILGLGLIPTATRLHMANNRLHNRQRNAHPKQRIKAQNYCRGRQNHHNLREQRHHHHQNEKKDWRSNARTDRRRHNFVAKLIHRNVAPVEI